MRATVAAALLATALAAQTQPEGERIFLAHCSDCHGPRGDGGRGANLARPILRHAPDEPSLLRVIAEGIPGTEMPRTRLSETQLRQVATFIRSLGRRDPAPVAGDAARGAELYNRHDCARCHTLGGRGGAIGPDLSGAGARMGPLYLRESLTDPEKALPPDFLQLRVRTRAGRVIAGVRINEDGFALQVRDLDDRYHSFWKSEVLSIDRQKGRSPMPSYRELSAKDLDDLVAYLAAEQEKR